MLKKDIKDLRFVPSRPKAAGAVALVLVAVFVIINGQPSAADRWNIFEKKYSNQISSREIYIHPGELLDLMRDTSLYLNIFDVRKEADYNLYHLEGAKLLSFNEINDQEFVASIALLPENTVTVLISNGEKESTNAWKLLRAQNILNLYILEGGINNWIDTFGIDKEIALRRKNKVSEDQLKYAFKVAIGDKHCSSNPCILDSTKYPVLKYEKKVKLKTKKILQGGCG